MKNKLAFGLVVICFVAQALNLHASNPCNWQIVTTWGTPSAGTDLNETDSHWYFGFYAKSRDAFVFDGSAAMTSNVSVQRGVSGWYDTATGQTSAAHTWKKKTLSGSGDCPSQARISFEITGMSSITGSELNAYSGFLWPYGDAALYTYTEGICSGLATGGTKPLGKVEGTVSMEESSSSASIGAGSYKVEVPVWGESWATVDGNDAILSGDTVDAGNAAYIKFDAWANSWAESKDGAAGANAHALALLESMTMEIVP